MVWQIRHNFDLEGGKEPLNLRFPFVEMEMFFDPDMKLPTEFEEGYDEAEQNTIKYTNNKPSPR